MNKKLLNTIEGALFGVAVGDALGAPVEFMSAEEIKSRHGRITEMIGGGWLGVKPGEITDDTQMTICVANGIVHSPEDPVEAVGYNFIQWINGGPKDVGGTCSSSIREAIRLGEEHDRGWLPTKDQWKEASCRTDIKFNGRSAGNGSLMRTVYAGLYYTNDEEIRLKAAEISTMTHWDQEAGNACQLYCSIIGEMCKRRGDRYSIFQKRIMASVYDSVITLGDEFKPIPSGYVKDSLRAAIWAVNKSRNFREAVENAVNLGGDADTIGAITGGLAGAIYGYDDIPDTWKEALSEDTISLLHTLAEYAAENHVDRKTNL